MAGVQDVEGEEADEEHGGEQWRVDGFVGLDEQLFGGQEEQRGHTETEDAGQQRAGAEPSKRTAAMAPTTSTSDSSGGTSAARSAPCPDG